MRLCAQERPFLPYYHRTELPPPRTTPPTPHTQPPAAPYTDTALGPDPQPDKQPSTAVLQSTASELSAALPPESETTTAEPPTQQTHPEPAHPPADPTLQGGPE